MQVEEDIVIVLVADGFVLLLHGAIVPNGIGQESIGAVALAVRIVFEVTPYDPATSDHLPGSEAGAPGGVNLEAMFGASGFTCTNAKAKTDLKNYGFLVTPLCGVTG